MHPTTMERSLVLKNNLLLENSTPEEILEEINERKERFKFLRYLSWIFAIIFFFLLADIFFFEITNLRNFGDFTTPIRIILFFAYAWGNLHMIHDFLTNKMQRLNLIPFLQKLAFVGWNIVCLGHLIGYF